MTQLEQDLYAAVRRAARDITKHLSETDWETRRWQAAMAVFPRCFDWQMRNDPQFDFTPTYIKCMAEMALECADELVRQAREDCERD